MRIDKYNQQAIVTKDSVNPKRFLKLEKERSQNLQEGRKILEELKTFKEKIASEFFQ